MALANVDSTTLKLTVIRPMARSTESLIATVGRSYAAREVQRSPAAGSHPENGRCLCPGHERLPWLTVTFNLGDAAILSVRHLRPPGATSPRCFGLWKPAVREQHSSPYLPTSNRCSLTSRARTLHERWA